MAARTPTSSVADAVGARAHKGYEHRTYAFAAVANNDTWTSGILNMRDVAWTATTTGDAVAATFAATGVVTFNSAGTEAGTLHVWLGAAR